MTLSIEEQFTYHPPTTEQRKKAHEECNNLALNFARFIDVNVKDENCKRMAIFALQQARMSCNQGITIDELNFLDEFEQRMGEFPKPEEISKKVANVVKNLNEVNEERTEDDSEIQINVFDDDVWDDEESQFKDEPVEKSALSSRIKQHLNSSKGKGFGKK